MVFIFNVHKNCMQLGEVSERLIEVHQFPRSIGTVEILPEFGECTWFIDREGLASFRSVSRFGGVVSNVLKVVLSWEADDGATD